MHPRGEEVTKKRFDSHLASPRRGSFHNNIVFEVASRYEVSIYPQDAPDLDVCPRLEAVVSDRHVFSIYVGYGECELDVQEDQDVVFQVQGREATRLDGRGPEGSRFNGHPWAHFHRILSYQKPSNNNLGSTHGQLEASS